VSGVDPRALPIATAVGQRLCHPRPERCPVSGSRRPGRWEGVVVASTSRKGSGPFHSLALRYDGVVFAWGTRADEAGGAVDEGLQFVCQG